MVSSAREERKYNSCLLPRLGEAPRVKTPGHEALVAALPRTMDAKNGEPFNGARNEPGEPPPPLNEFELVELHDKKKAGGWLDDDDFMRMCELEERNRASSIDPKGHAAPKKSQNVRAGIQNESCSPVAHIL